MPDVLELGKLNSLLKTERFGKASAQPNEVWESIGSTNTRAAELAARGAPEGVLVLARHQSRGRGRLGRVWLSPPDAGIFMSVILRPGKPHSELQLLTLACGVAVADAIEAVSGVKVRLKWVNDLVVERRKIGGILAEMPANSSATAPSEQALPGGQDSSSRQAVIVGLGINLNYDGIELPPEIESKVDWLNRLSEDPPDPNELAATIAASLETTIDALFSDSTNSTSNLLDRWRARSVTLGSIIRTEYSGEVLEAVAVDIAENGALIVEKFTGERLMLHAGEVSVRAPDGNYC